MRFSIPKKTIGFIKKETNKMRNFKPFAYGLTLSLALSLALSAQALAQDAPKTLAENSKAKVSESTVAAGAVINVGAPTGTEGPFFARYYLTGGTVEYTYADGKKETVVRKTGSAVIISATDKRPTTIKNTGNTALHIITVSVK
jgi:hypothetical protein